MVSEAVREIVDELIGVGSGLVKTLSANDTGRTGGHQSGFLVPIKAGPFLFPRLARQDKIENQPIRITWPQFDRTTDSCAKWYASKGEYRITGELTRVLDEGHAGAFLLMVPTAAGTYSAVVTDTDEDADYVRSTFSLPPTFSSGLVKNIGVYDLEERKRCAFTAFYEEFCQRQHGRGKSKEFPSTAEMSQAARQILEDLHPNRLHRTKVEPDDLLLRWVECEFDLFRHIEAEQIAPRIVRGFDSVDDFITCATTLKNRRASRAGAGLEQHVKELLTREGIVYEWHGTTELEKQPDFLFPSSSAYADPTYPCDKLAMLAVKTTCKDRWRQVLSEADRLPQKYLLTLQQGVSAAQMKEMTEAGVTLVVPKKYHECYPRQWRSRVWTLAQFIEFVKGA